MKCPYKKRQVDSCGEGDRNWSHTATAKGIRGHQKLEEEREKGFLPPIAFGVLRTP